MRDASTSQRLSGFMFLMLNGVVRPGARSRVRVRRAGGRVLVLFAILVAAHAGNAHAADGPFVPIDLGTLGAGTTGPFEAASWTTAVNASGQVVGNSYVPNLNLHHAFSWTRAGGMRDLGTLGGSETVASAVNASGQVVGDSYTSVAGDIQNHAFLWSQAEGMIDLGTFGGFYTHASAVNATGHVVGESDLAGYPRTTHAFSWTRAGGMIDLGTLGGRRSAAVAVNDSSRVVGHSFLAGDNVGHAFSWDGSGRDDRPRYPQPEQQLPICAER